MPEQVTLTQEKETLLMALYLRALDNRMQRPILGDQYAQPVIDQIDYDFDRLRDLRGNGPLIAARARRFDRWATEFLTANPDSVVLHLACGLDSRPLRLDRPPGTTWIDVDYPEVIALRERLYGPIDGVRFVGSSVTESAWWDDIPADRPTLVLAEGLLMYLAPYDVHQLLARALDRLPSGVVAFDAVAGWVRTIARWQRSMHRAGAEFHWALPSAAALPAVHRRLRLADDCSAARLVADVTENPVLRASYRALALTPPIRDAMRLVRYRF